MLSQLSTLRHSTKVFLALSRVNLKQCPDALAHAASTLCPHGAPHAVIEKSLTCQRLQAKLISEKKKNSKMSLY